MMVRLSLASLLAGVSSSTEGTTRQEKGEDKGAEKGEESKNPQKTQRSQFWYDVSYDQALLCETYFALTTHHASGVLCRGICVRCITLAVYFILPCRCGVRNTRCTPPKGNPKCICLPSVAKGCTEGQEKTHDNGFLNCGSNHQVTLSEPFGAYGSLDTPDSQIISISKLATRMDLSCSSLLVAGPGFDPICATRQLHTARLWLHLNTLPEIESKQNSNSRLHLNPFSGWACPRPCLFPSTAFPCMTHPYLLIQDSS